MAVSEPLTEATALSAADLRRLDLLCDEFEQSWQTGTPPELESYLPRVEDSLRPVLQEELLRLDLEWRCRRREVIVLDDYSRRFPGQVQRFPEWVREAQAAAEMGSPETAPGTPPTVSTAPPRPAATEAPPANSLPRVLGEYELVRLLGAGGMGEVYEGRHRRLGKRVAVKLLPVSKQTSATALDRFARETAAVGGLDHPHLVEAHDAGEYNGQVYLVLKYLDGIDLQRLVRQDGPLPVATACDLVRQAALGLQHLHERGLVHRDIKPSNLMRLPDGTLKVLDLGLARWQDAAPSGSDLTAPGSPMGTPDYAAPEQAEDAGRADIRADLYGLGGTLFYLLTGRAPFGDRKTTVAKWMAHVEEAPPDVRTLRPEVPAAVAAVVARLLAKKPAERFATPREVAAELERLLADLKSPTAEPVATRAATVRPARSLPWRFVGPLALSAAVLVVVGVYQLIPSPNRADRPEPGNAAPAPTPAVRPTERLVVRKLEVEHWEKKGNEGHYPRGLLGEKSFTTQLGDIVTIRAELSEPAYCYLVAYRPDGTEELCFPEQENEPPALTTRPGYGSSTTGKGYGLTDGTGLEVFCLVASRQPLPAYAEWKRSRGAAPWRATAALSDVVWRHDGEELRPLTVENAVAQRGKDSELQGGGMMLGRLVVWWRQAPEIEAVAGIGFPVVGR